MVLRLPRGYAVVLVLGIFIIFALAYMAGYVRGERHGAEEMRQRYSELLESAERHDDPFATPHVIDPGGPEDPRIGGYYYFRLIANHSEEVARSLVAFTRARGVETFATVSNNDRFNVWAAQPFVRDDRTRGDRDSFRETLHGLGRQWRSEQQQPEDLFNASLIQYRPR